MKAVRGGGKLIIVTSELREDGEVGIYIATLLFEDYTCCFAPLIRTFPSK